VNVVVLFQAAQDADSINWEAFEAIATGLAALFTGFAAGFTAWMAWLTRKVLLDGQAARKESNDHYQATRTQDNEHFEQTREQDREHHQDSFRPLLVLNQSDENDAQSRRNILRAAGGHKGRIFIQTSVQNIGVGPALNVRLRVRPPYLCAEEPFCDIDPVEARALFRPAGGSFQINAADTSNLTDQEVIDLSTRLWSLILEYEDVFGNTFHTIHARDLRQPWTRTERGPAPAFLRASPEVMAIVNQGDANAAASGIGA
jgi:hypothetical protein